MHRILMATTAGLALTAAVAGTEAHAGITLQVAGSYPTDPAVLAGLFDEGAAEIPAYHWQSRRLFVVNGATDSIDVLQINPDLTLTPLAPIDVSAFGSPNSVAVKRGIVAVAVEAPLKTSPGQVRFYDVKGRFLNAVTVGALPDMVTFDKDGTRVLTADEGEPGEEGEPDAGVDPEGSISVVDLSAGVANASVVTLGFGAFDRAGLLARGVRLPDATVTAAQDLEPEYIAVSKDGTTAYVTLQENNAVATIDLTVPAITGIAALGTKEHEAAGSGLDASDDDGAINIQPWPVLGMYMPDAVIAYRAKGRDYIVTANEGDARDGLDEEVRVADLDLDPTVFSEAATLQQDANLGRLTVSRLDGDADGDGRYEALYAYGARSFTIWSPGQIGAPVFDSGDQLEQVTAAALPLDFNSTNDRNGSFDNRSDNKGPEPEGLAFGWVGGKALLFVGLERISGIAVYDVTQAAAPEFVTFAHNRDFSGDAEAGTAGDLGPEGLLFIPGSISPSGEPLLVVANEVSGTTTVWRIVEN